MTLLNNKLARGITILLCIAGVFTTSEAFSEFLVCRDSDTPTNNSLVRGTAELWDRSNSSPTLLKRGVDVCNSTGTRLLEYKCINNFSSAGTPAGTDQLVSETIDCLFGCLGGACANPGPNNDGCFTRILVQAQTSTTDHNKWVLSVREVTQQVAPLWIYQSRSAALKNGDETLEAQILGVNNELLSVAYSSFHPQFFDVEDASLSNTIVSELIIAFNPNARSILLKGLGTQVLLALPSQSQRCNRPCLASAVAAGREGVDTCCPGTVKSPVNPQTFVCLPSPSPSPSSAP